MVDLIDGGKMQSWNISDVSLKQLRWRHNNINVNVVGCWIMCISNLYTHAGHSWTLYMPIKLPLIAGILGAIFWAQVCLCEKQIFLAPCFHLLKLCNAAFQEHSECKSSDWCLDMFEAETNKAVCVPSSCLHSYHCPGSLSTLKSRAPSCGKAKYLSFTVEQSQPIERFKAHFKNYHKIIFLFTLKFIQLFKNMIENEISI